MAKLQAAHNQGGSSPGGDVARRQQQAGGNNDKQKQQAKEHEAKSDVLAREARGRLSTLLVVSTAMLILPLATYFGIRHYIVDSTTIAAMGAIVAVQIIVAGYIYKAWHDENKDHQASLKEKLKKR